MEINPKFKIGEIVEIITPSIKGTIISYVADGNFCLYNVRYFSDSVFTVMTFYDHELIGGSNG